MNTDHRKSAQPCGCDEGAGHVCQWHACQWHVYHYESLQEESMATDGRTVGVYEGPRYGFVPTAEEVRVVDPTTGGEKGAKLARFSLIPGDFLWALAEHYGRGARKYADRNWEKGYKWSLTVDALHRHLVAWLEGEDNDSETGSSHLIAVAWHVVALWWYHKHSKGTDDVRRTR